MTARSGAQVVLSVDPPPGWVGALRFTSVADLRARKPHAAVSCACGVLRYACACPGGKPEYVVRLACCAPVETGAAPQ